MRRPRDTQKSRCYAWERAANKELLGRSLYESEPGFEALEACEAFLNPIWRAERGRVGLAKAPPPTLSRNLWGQRSASATGHHELKLPKWARSRWVMLHELAHRLTPADAGHGGRFVGVLIGLLARHVGLDADRLMRLADEHGLKYHVRSIGVVPIFGPVKLVEHILVTERPMTAMDIACALSLGHGADIDVRQVRGAALNLIRAGRARWLRGKLTPLETA